jgi:UDP-glucose 4-epimerase
MNVVVTGGAGFIGSNLVDRLMSKGHRVTVVDNLSGGHRAFIAHHEKNPKFEFVEMDLRDTPKLIKAMPKKTDLVFHLAANANIAAGVNDPTLDYEHSLVATFSLLQAMRHHGVKKLFYTSGSGVYGEDVKKPAPETLGPLFPISMYGATKLGAEGLVSAFCHLFDMRAWMLRPANIIGPNATHGVVFDFVKRLRAEPTKLRILGDGHQTKAYLHVSDVIDAMMLVIAKGKERINIFNLSSNSYIEVNEIARIVLREMKLKDVKITHTPGTVGWKGDIALVRLNNRRLAKLGWRANYTSAQAVRATVRALQGEKRK